MSISFNTACSHQVVLANSHTYPVPTEPLYLDRTLIYHDLIYLIDGEWQFSERINGNEINYLLKPNDVLILKAGNHHYTRLPCKANTRTFCIHITSEEGDFLQTHPALVKINPQIDCNGSPRIYAYFKEIIDVFWSSDPQKEFKMSALATLLLYELHAQQFQKKEHPVEKALQLINESPHKTFKTSEMASLLRMNPNTLTQVFKEVTGKSFHSYQVDKKLEMVALQMQIEPDIRLKELASIFNFCDEFYLSKLFKRKYGLSPIQYKQKMSLYHQPPYND